MQPYQFILPTSWKQTRVANILSGNYCQPKCAEPWVEVKFENERQGKVQVVASPLIRLTNKPNATIEEIGSPEKVISSLGPFVTGNSYDPDELLETSIEKVGDQTVNSCWLVQLVNAAFVSYLHVQFRHQSSWSEYSLISDGFIIINFMLHTIELHIWMNAKGNVCYIQLSHCLAYFST